MKKAFLIIPLLLVITASPVLANQGEEHRSEKAQVKEAVKEDKVEKVEVGKGEPTGEYKNHGAYVSEVAKTHPGGAVVSAAARSDIGKKKQSSTTPTPTDIITPTPTAIVTPTVTPTITVAPTSTPTAEPTPSATPSPTLTITQDDTQLLADNGFLNVKGILKSLSNFLKSLTHHV